ncbi:MAG TPA: thioredoxin family protein [Ignavibacteriales bacterium]|nr:thioredoxin family protein [Ignavibacteriales bacterium]
MFIDDNLKEELKKQLMRLRKKVKMVYFTQELECQFCRETRQLLQELSEVSDMIDLEIKNFVTDKEDAQSFNVDKIPATVLLDENGTDYGIKFYGIPSGYEFSSLLEDIIMLGTGETDLPKKVMDDLKSINQPVHMQVFVTPTCPYCPSAVVTAHRFAYLNKNIKAEMIEATEFPHLTVRYNVRGVPRTVINETDFLEGAAPEHMVLDKIFKNLEELKQEEVKQAK